MGTTTPSRRRVSGRCPQVDHQRKAGEHDDKMRLPSSCTNHSQTRSNRVSSVQMNIHDDARNGRRIVRQEKAHRSIRREIFSRQRLLSRFFSATPWKPFLTD